MKKILSILFVAIISTAVFAQETTTTDVLVSKKGNAILPVAGDIAIGADALPILDYLGNALNGTAANTIALPSTTIFGRYYIADDMAIRANLTIANTTDITKTLVNDVVTAGNTVENKVSVKTSDIRIGVGVQKSRGYGRLRGNYGLLLNYRYQDGSTKREYGNSLSNAYTAHTTGGGVTSSKDQATNTLEFGPVVGVEYYFAPKMCIGAEVNLLWSGVFSNTPTETVTETWVAGALVKTEVTKDDAGSVATKDRGLDTYGVGCLGGIYLMFHF